MIWSDTTIIERMAERITPFAPSQVRRHAERGPVISHGVSGSGYDVRLGCDLKVQDPDLCEIDPKGDGLEWLDYRIDGSQLWYRLKPGECVLGVTMERIDMPDDVAALCIGKSTYARCGLLVNATPIEAGWRGHITLELSNVGRLPIRIYPGEGIAQLVFQTIDRRPAVTYGDRSGKYQDQRAEPVAARI